MTIRNNREKDDVTAKLLERFKKLIEERVLSPGCRLLPERMLAQRFGVSRSSLRLALKVLEAMGVLVQRVGDGTYLNPDASAVLAKPMEFLVLMEDISVGEFYEARLIVEPESAARASEYARPEHLVRLENALTGMMRESIDKTEYARLDLDFHETIFLASGNRACELIFTMFHRALWTSVMRTFGITDLRLGIGEHEAIYSAIRRRQPREARRKMSEHIIRAKAIFERVSESRTEAAMAEEISPISR